MRPDVGIRYLVGINHTANHKAAGAEAMPGAAVAGNQFRYGLAGGPDDDLAEPFNLGFVRLQGSHPGMVGLAGPGNRRVAQIDPAPGKCLRRPYGAGDQNRSGPTRLHAEPDSRVHGARILRHAFDPGAPMLLRPGTSLRFLFLPCLRPAVFAVFGIPRLLALPGS